MQAITLLHALKNNLSDLTLKYPFAYNPVGSDHSLPSTRINLNHCWHLIRFCQRYVRSTDFFVLKCRYRTLLWRQIFILVLQFLAQLTFQFIAVTRNGYFFIKLYGFVYALFGETKKPRDNSMYTWHGRFGYRGHT